MERLTGRVALISGAASGIGQATAERLAAEGAAVMVTDVNDQGGKEVAAELTAAGHRAAYQHLEVTSEQDWQQAVAVTVAQFGGLDILVNNAGVTGEAGPAGGSHAGKLEPQHRHLADRGVPRAEARRARPAANRAMRR